MGLADFKSVGSGETVAGGSIPFPLRQTANIPKLVCVGDGYGFIKFIKDIEA